jgi:hypothetical protein
VAAAGRGDPDSAEPSPSTAPLGLVGLDAASLGLFLELCFADRRLVALCRELQIITPGYRLESLRPEQVARVLADEYLEAEDVRARLEAAVRAVLLTPMFEGRSLPPDQLPETLQDALDAIATGDPLQHLARAAWAGLLAGSAEGKEVALDALDLGARFLSAPAGSQAEVPADAKEARKLVQKARRDVGAAQKKQERAERERDSQRELLAAARSEIAARDRLLAEERAAAERTSLELARASGELARLTHEGVARALGDAKRVEAEARSLAERLEKSEAARAELEAQGRTLVRQVAEAEVRAQAAPQAEPVEEGQPTEEEAATFLVPVLTREFYDSIARWSRRMQRAAFDKIHRLGVDWRHGSLRALALEGLPGYYRIRVATDVRLIYRRDGNQLEILSLIDREDLDRYVRQARTR